MTSLISGTLAADDDSSTDRGLMPQRLLAISSKDTISLVKVNEAFLSCAIIILSLDIDTASSLKHRPLSRVRSAWFLLLTRGFSSWLEYLYSYCRQMILVENLNHFKYCHFKSHHWWFYYTCTVLKSVSKIVSESMYNLYYYIFNLVNDA